MDTMTDTKSKVQETVDSLIERANDTTQDWGLSTESPLSVERSGKFVNVLFSTGGPHTEILAEYWDDESAEYWYENEPAGAWVTFKDWGTREDLYISAMDANLIMQAITRDPEELTADTES